jgi:lauroyl/myristoyl acyltransferase
MLAAQIVGFEAAAAVSRAAGRRLWPHIPLVNQDLRAAIAGALGATHSASQVDEIPRGFATDYWLTSLEAEFIERRLRSRTWRLWVHAPAYARLGRHVATGAGVICAGTYLGNYLVGLAALGLFLEGRVTAIVQADQSPTQHRLMVALARRRVATLVPPGDAIHRSLAALRGGQAVVMTMEHARSGAGAVEADFLGARVPFHTTPAVLAQRTKCPIAVVACIRRDPPFHFEGRIYDWIEPSFGKGRDAAAEVTKRVVSALDAAIREHPEQYNWLRFLARTGAEPQAAARQPP